MILALPLGEDLGLCWFLLVVMQRFLFMIKKMNTSRISNYTVIFNNIQTMQGIGAQFTNPVAIRLLNHYFLSVFSHIQLVLSEKHL